MQPGDTIGLPDEIDAGAHMELIASHPTPRAESQTEPATTRALHTVTNSTFDLVITSLVEELRKSADLQAQLAAAKAEIEALKSSTAPQQ